MTAVPFGLNLIGLKIDDHDEDLICLQVVDANAWKELRSKLMMKSRYEKPLYESNNDADDYISVGEVMGALNVIEDPLRVLGILSILEGAEYFGTTNIFKELQQCWVRIQNEENPAFSPAGPAGSVKSDSQHKDPDQMEATWFKQEEGLLRSIKEGFIIKQLSNDNVILIGIYDESAATKYRLPTNSEIADALKIGIKYEP